MKAIYHTFTNVFQNNKILDFSGILILAILISLPLGSFAINSIAVILFFINATINIIIKKQKVNFNKISFLLIAIYILCILSLFWSDNLRNTFEGLIRFLSYLVLPVAFGFSSSQYFQKEKIINFFSKFLCLLAFYCLFLGVCNSITHSDLSYLFYHKLSSSLGNLNAIYFSIYISIGIVFFFQKKNKAKMDIFLISFLLFFLILLSSKLIIAITFIYLFLYLLINKKYRNIKKKYIYFVLGLSILFVLASKNLSNRVKFELEKTKVEEVLTKKDFGHIYPWTGLGLRVFQARVFFEVLKERNNILLGFGLNNSQKSLNEKYKTYNLYPGFLNYNYHNQYIQVFAELGIIGFLILVSIFFLILYKAILDKDHFLLYFTVLIVAVCFTESFLWRQRGMVFFLTITLLFYNKKECSR